MTGVQVYVVFKRGVYRHECGGVFATEDEAKAHATALAASDKDSYHEYEVFPFQVGVGWNSHLCGPGPDGYDGREPACIFRIRKSDTAVSKDAPSEGS